MASESDVHDSDRSSMDLVRIDRQLSESSQLDGTLRLLHRKRHAITTLTAAAVGVLASLTMVWALLAVVLGPALPVSGGEAIFILVLVLVLLGLVRIILLARLASREDALADEMERQIEIFKRERLTRSMEHLAKEIRAGTRADGQPNGEA